MDQRTPCAGTQSKLMKDCEAEHFSTTHTFTVALDFMVSWGQWFSPNLFFFYGTWVYWMEYRTYASEPTGFRGYS